MDIPRECRRLDLQIRPQAINDTQISGAPVNHTQTTQVQPHRQLPMSIVPLAPSRRTISRCARRDKARVISSPNAQGGQSSSNLNNHTTLAVLPTRKALV
ncbi:hypothetical protein IFM89_006125 [Coptis chinensis]|uniref:Uncharacterized protein n=1 Tax=Coptis chinensis TaxID=261450 RepID=A0A835GW19_9MAGN|nr:hypothetical protein IFM89_006125 [Coptis chinensis]